MRKIREKRMPYNSKESEPRKGVAICWCQPIRPEKVRALIAFGVGSNTMSPWRVLMATEVHRPKSVLDPLLGEPSILWITSKLAEQTAHGEASKES